MLIFRGDSRRPELYVRAVIAGPTATMNRKQGYVFYS
jgi:hypothetical protein